MFPLVHRLQREAVFNGFSGVAESGGDDHRFIVTHSQLVVCDLHPPRALEHPYDQFAGGNLGADALTLAYQKPPVHSFAGSHIPLNGCRRELSLDTIPTIQRHLEFLFVINPLIQAAVASSISLLMIPT